MISHVDFRAIEYSQTSSKRHNSSQKQKSHPFFRLACAHNVRPPPGRIYEQHGCRFSPRYAPYITRRCEFSRLDTYIRPVTTSRHKIKPALGAQLKHNRLHDATHVLNEKLPTRCAFCCQRLRGQDFPLIWKIKSISAGSGFAGSIADLKRKDSPLFNCIRKPLRKWSAEELKALEEDSASLFNL